MQILHSPEFQRNTVQLSRNTISIPRNPESSSLARDNREYVEFLSSMFVVGVHRSGGAREATRCDATSVRAGDRPTHFREMRQNTRMVGYNQAFANPSLTYVHLPKYELHMGRWPHRLLLRKALPILRHFQPGMSVV